MDTFEPTPGPVLRKQRKRLGISVTVLSAHAGVTRVTLTAWENHYELDAARVETYQRALTAADRARKAYRAREAYRAKRAAG